MDTYGESDVSLQRWRGNVWRNILNLRLSLYVLSCKKGIIKEMLTKEEIEWLNNYHQTVYEKLSPDLNEEEKAWLQKATTSI